MRSAEQIINAIYGSYQTGSKNGHRNVLALLDALHVTMKTPVIHVAGTNGKGSTCAMLAAVLKAAGYKVGLYTSPFLQQYQERIRLNGVPLTDDLMVKYGNPLVDAAEVLQAENAFVTPFEMGTALALSVFDGEGCDFAIVEVGMGGRLDPTNIVKPIACAIAAIGLDHMGFLGNTVEKIAGEKAGVIKPGVPVVCQMAQESVRRVFADAAAAVNAPVIQLDESMILAASGDAYGSTVTYQLENRWEDLQLSLPGGYQVHNALAVVALAEELRRQGHAIPDKAVREGLANTVWPARLEWCGSVLIDGAHNPQGVEALVNFVDNFLPDKRRVLLTGVLADKLQSEVLHQLVHIAPDMITVTPDTPRAMAAADFAALLNAHGANARAANSLHDGLQMARDLAGDDAVIIAAGSLYFAGALRTELGLSWR